MVASHISPGAPAATVHHYSGPTSCSTCRHNRPGVADHQGGSLAAYVDIGLLAGPPHSTRQKAHPS